MMNWNENIRKEKAHMKIYEKFTINPSKRKELNNSDLIDFSYGLSRKTQLVKTYASFFTHFHNDVLKNDIYRSRPWYFYNMKNLCFIEI